MKNSWLKFTERFGETILHPQYIVKKIEYKSVDFANKYAKGKLLDIGCGNMPYKAKLKKIKKYVGLDYPTTKKLYEGAPEPDVLGDAKELPFKDRSFDSVLMLQVLEHVDEPNLAVKEAARVLKKGGVIIVSIPFMYPIHDAPYDYTRFTEFSLKKMFNKNFKIIKFSIDGTFVDFVMQSIILNLLNQSKDLLLNRKLVYKILGGLLLVCGFCVGFVTNMISLVLNSLNIFNETSLFPLNYTFVALKK